MAHDVLISYSSRDKLQADAICNRLESRGIRCWIAPRDVGLGEYAEKIVEAIEQAKIMVLVYSANADESHQVRREVERAVSKGTTIVPVRIEDHEMSKAFELYVGSMHWLDAITPPLEEHIDKLADQLQALLSADAPEQPGPSVGSTEPAAPSPTAPPAQSAAAGSASGKGKLMLGAAVVALVALVLFLLLGTESEDGSPDEDGVAGQATGGPAPGEPSVESSDDAMVEMMFENTTGVPVLVSWVNEEGEEELYETLEPGQGWAVDTYEGDVWVVRAAEADGELEIAECTSPANDSTCDIDLVTGWDVAWVEFEVGGERSRPYVQTGPGSWVEEGPDGGIRFTFSETGRDDWSVYLRDEARQVDIQLDLWTNMVYYSDAQSPRRPLYRIVAVSD